MIDASNVKMDKTNKGNNSNVAVSAKVRGTMIMKSVSILIVNSRRLCNHRSKEASVENAAKQTVQRKNRPNKMDDTIGKPTPKLLDSLKRRTHFTKKELLVLCRIYRKLVLNCYTSNTRINTAQRNNVVTRPHSTADGIDRNIFRELLHNTFDVSADDSLMERIFISWDKGNEILPLRLENWISGISVFLRGTLHEKAGFCFRIYDLNADGFITKDEMFTLMKNCLIKQPQDEDPEESVKDLMEIVLKKFDIDKDGKISFQDYWTSVTAEPLLLEAFGQCLPSEGTTTTFLTTFQGRSDLL